MGRQDKGNKGMQINTVRNILINPLENFTEIFTEGGKITCQVYSSIFHSWWTSRDGIRFTLIMGTPDADNLLDGLGTGRIWIQHQYRTRKGLQGPIKVLFIDLI